MDGDAADEPITHVWRMPAGPQAQFLLIALIVAGIGAIMGGGAILYPSYVIIGTVVIIAACIGATWSALQLRSSLTLTGNTLIVRTATKTHRIPFQQVTYVSAGAYGIYIRTSDGLRIKSLVAENSRWSQRFGQTIRVSALMTVLGGACLIGGCAAGGAQTDGAAALLAHGARAPGTVTNVSKYHMDVRYVRDGKPASARINLNDSSDVYHKRDRVTVVYDPAHPDRARTIREDGQSQGSVLVMAVLLVAGAFLLIGGISNLIRARRQLPSGVRAISLLRIHGRAL